MPRLSFSRRPGARTRRGSGAAPSAAFGIALIALGAAGPSRASPATARVLATTWTEVRTEHFTVVTDAGGRVGTGVGRRLEQFGAALSAANPELRAFPALPTDVFVFRDRPAMDAFRSAEAEHLPGYATSGPLRNVILVSVERDAGAMNHALCHEYTHVFNAANVADMPLWLDEGLAEYYGTFRPLGPVFEVGHRRAALMDWLHRNELADLDLLFAASPDAPAYRNPNPLRNTLYAQGWMMARYLADRREADFHRFIGLMRRGTAARRAFESVFPRAEWPELMARVRRYVRDDALDFRSQRYAPPAVAPRVRSLGEAEVLLRFGELVDDLSPDGHRAALEYYAASLDRDSLQAAAWARLGLAAEKSGDTARAESAFRRAIALAPDEPMPHLLAGMAAVMRANRIAFHDEADLPAAHAWLAAGRERLTRCLRASPRHPAALAAFGASFLPEPEIPAEALRALEQAAAEMPSRRDVAEDLERARGTRARWAWEQPMAEARTAQPDRPAEPLRYPSHAAMIEAMREAQREAEYQSRMSKAWRAGARGDREQVVRWLLKARIMTTSTAEIDSMVRVERAALKLDRARELATAGRLRAARDTIATQGGLPAEHELMRSGRELQRELTARLEIERALALARAGDVTAARAAFESVTRMPVDESIRRYARERVRDLDAKAAR